jgi:hypothetical protein
VVTPSYIYIYILSQKRHSEHTVLESAARKRPMGQGRPASVGAPPTHARPGASVSALHAWAALDDAARGHAQPSGHSAHVSLPAAANRPAGHGDAVPFAAPTPQVYPAGHWPQVSPGESPNVPLGHATAVALVEPAAHTKPGRHGRHCVDRSPLGPAVLYLPATHCK